jgi:5-methylcytosine-specific restriction endonuclease McrA
VWNEALELAGRTSLGPAAPKWQRVEAICQEYLGAHVCPEDVTEKDMALSAPVSDWLEEFKADLEKATRQWEYLDRVDPVVAPVPSVPVMEDPILLDQELRRLARMRAEWDELFGHLAMVFKLTGLWRDAGFASFGHYCTERLGMSVRAVEQRIALERRLYALPTLRQALRERRITYEKARAIAWYATDKTVDHWIERARGIPCIALRREIEAREEAQISARGDLDLRMPVRVHQLLEDAMRAARAAAGKWITPSERLKRIAQHFIDVHKDDPKPRKTVQHRVRERDGWCCLAPGCSRVNPMVHHVVFRSKGGNNNKKNLASVCRAHHLCGIHEGLIRVSGDAPDGLRWSLTSPVEADPWWRGDDPARSTDDGDTLICEHE